MKYNMTEIDWLKYGTSMDHSPVDALVARVRAEQTV